eukprot:TRINITY_DN15660_c0_g1_i2.p2 TRINITY_DN15660_c0_g1~~TRINITY_DN15660_c0_g1_i2.p2  ORF type:complete len:110 (-),score=25.96 TRINITY_DN15660_c0_g1_i2:78-407(-)
MFSMMTWDALHDDLYQVLVVLVCVCAGWAASASLIQTLPLPHNKTIEFDDKLAADSKIDENEDSDAFESCRELFVNDEELPVSLQILEQYGVLGATPGTWTSKVRHKAV